MTATPQSAWYLAVGGHCTHERLPGRHRHGRRSRRLDAGSRRPRPWLLPRLLRLGILRHPRLLCGGR